MLKQAAWAVGAASSLVGVLHYGIHGQAAQVFGPSIYRGSTKLRQIALTFDDGPSEGSLQLLDYLAKEDVKATFFQCGMNVERHPQIARRIAAAGHELSNHTYSHPHLPPRLNERVDYKSPEFIYHEFARTQRIIEDAAGVLPRLLRAPYGLRWFGLRAVQKHFSLLGVMWTVIGHDWEWPAQRVSELVLAKAAPGGIVCLHDGRDVQPNPDVSEMLGAIKTIVPVLRDRGFTFHTVSDLIGRDWHQLPSNYGPKS